MGNIFTTYFHVVQGEKSASRESDVYSHALYNNLSVNDKPHL